MASITPLLIRVREIHSRLLGHLHDTAAHAGGGGVEDHGDLTGRDAADSHPLAAITGLVAALADRVLNSDARLSDQRVPTDGSVTDAKVAAGAGIAKSKLAALAIVDADVAAGAAIAESKLSLASDAAAGTASRRTLGTGATQAAAGNHGPHHANHNDLASRSAADAHPTSAVTGLDAALASKADAHSHPYVSTGLFTAKGDLIVRDGTGAIVRLPVSGVNGRVLTEDSSAAGGVSWQTPATGVTDHGGLTGLADNDHPQYVLGTAHTKAAHDALALAHSSLAGLAGDAHPDLLTDGRFQTAYDARYNIGQKAVTDLPGTYPVGVSHFNADGSGWPASSTSNVITFKYGSNQRVLQLNIYRGLGDRALPSVYARGVDGSTGDGAWGAWKALDDHAALSNLASDHHTQYYNAARLATEMEAWAPQNQVLITSDSNVTLAANYEMLTDNANANGVSLTLPSGWGSFMAQFHGFVTVQFNQLARAVGLLVFDLEMDDGAGFIALENHEVSAFHENTATHIRIPVPISYTRPTVTANRNVRLRVSTYTPAAGAAIVRADCQLRVTKFRLT